MYFVKTIALECLTSSRNGRSQWNQLVNALKQLPQGQAILVPIPIDESVEVFRNRLYCAVCKRIPIHTSVQEGKKELAVWKKLL